MIKFLKRLLAIVPMFALCVASGVTWLVGWHIGTIKVDDVVFTLLKWARK